MNISMETFGLSPSREHDRMGVGYFYEGLSGPFKEAAGALLGDIQDLQGGEVYYNAEITPWFHLTADL
jgi:porin